MTHLLKTLFANPVFTGGFILMISGAVMALCRRVPAMLWVWTKRRFIITADVLGEDQAFQWLKIWLDAQPYSKRVRDVSISTGGYDCGPQSVPSSLPTSPVEPRRPRIIFTPAPGIHCFLYKGRVLWLNRERKEVPAQHGGYSTFREVMTIRVVGRSQEVIRQLINEAMEFALPPEDPRICITMSVNGYWRQVGLKQPRDRESVVLNAGVFDQIADDATRFLDSEKYYTNMGIPWRRGYLFV